MDNDMRADRFGGPSACAQSWQRYARPGS